MTVLDRLLRGYLALQSVARINRFDRICYVVLFALCFLILSWVHVYIYASHPLSMDEYNYLYQAKIFSSGRLAIPFDEVYTGFSELYTVVHNGHLFSKYPPGFSLLMSLAVPFSSAGFVNPLLSAFSICLLYKICIQIVSKSAAVSATLLAAISPYFWGYAASFYAQPFSLFINILCLYIFIRYLRSFRPIWLSRLAIVVAVGVWIRPLDALIVLLSILAGLLFYRPVGSNKKNFTEYLRKAAIISIPFGISVLLMMTYSSIVSGNFSIATYRIWNSEFQIQPGQSGSFLFQLRAALSAWWARIFSDMKPLVWKWFFVYSGFIVPTLALLGTISVRRERPLRVMLIAHILLQVLLYNFHESYFLGWPQFGARYYYPIFGSVVVLSAFGIETGKNLIKRMCLRMSSAEGIGINFYRMITGTVFILAVVLSLFLTWEKASVYRQRYDFVRLINEDLERSCPEKSVVLLSAPPRKIMSQFPLFVKWWDFKRNPFFNGPRYFTTTASAAYNLAGKKNLPLCSYNFALDDR